MNMKTADAMKQHPTVNQWHKKRKSPTIKRKTQYSSREVIRLLALYRDKSDELYEIMNAKRWLAAHRNILKKK